MSLDVYLKSAKRVKETCECCGGDVFKDKTYYTANITHNLTKLALASGLYEALWRPHRLREDYNVSEGDYDAEYNFENSVKIKAKEIIPVIEKGLLRLRINPESWQQYNSSNGWGMYSHFVPFVEKYLAECKKYPNAIVETSR
jgi:hypothetical protein